MSVELKTFPGPDPLRKAWRDAYHAYQNAIVKYRLRAPKEPAGPGSAIERWWDTCHADAYVAECKVALDAAWEAMG